MFSHVVSSLQQPHDVPAQRDGFASIGTLSCQRQIDRCRRVNSSSQQGRCDRAHRSLPAAWMISNMDAYSIKLTVIAALLLTLMYLFYDLMLDPLTA